MLVLLILFFCVLSFSTPAPKIAYVDEVTAESVYWAFDSNGVHLQDRSRRMTVPLCLLEGSAQCVLNNEALNAFRLVKTGLTRSISTGTIQFLLEAQQCEGSGYSITRNGLPRPAESMSGDPPSTRVDSGLLYSYNSGTFQMTPFSCPSSRYPNTRWRCEEKAGTIENCGMSHFLTGTYTYADLVAEYGKTAISGGEKVAGGFDFCYNIPSCIEIGDMQSSCAHINFELVTVLIESPGHETDAVPTAQNLFLEGDLINGFYGVSQTKYLFKPGFDITAMYDDIPFAGDNPAKMLYDSHSCVSGTGLPDGSWLCTIVHKSSISLDADTLYNGEYDVIMDFGGKEISQFRVTWNYAFQRALEVDQFDGPLVMYINTEPEKLCTSTVPFGSSSSYYVVEIATGFSRDAYRISALSEPILTVIYPDGSTKPLTKDFHYELSSATNDSIIAAKIDENTCFNTNDLREVSRLTLNADRIGITPGAKIKFYRDTFDIEQKARRDSYSTETERRSEYYDSSDFDGTYDSEVATMSVASYLAHEGDPNGGTVIGLMMFVLVGLLALWF